MVTFLRYPGGKRRMLTFLAEHLPPRGSVSGRFVEPFVGGGAIYFFMNPKKALLADINSELIDLYLGIQQSPGRIWEIYRQFPSTKAGYRRVRDLSLVELTPLQRAARSLFLNRTCFKGMWRHNVAGRFNIGYGGQSRRWSISRANLFNASMRLHNAQLKCSDFAEIIAGCQSSDYIFADPPYRPGEREQRHEHYVGAQFSYRDHQRLASSLKDADRRGVRWSLTISNHPDILKLYSKFSTLEVPRGTGRKIGVLARRSGEVLISNM